MLTKPHIFQLSLLFVLIIRVNVVAQSSMALTNESVGIKFFTGSWTDALAEAKRQNKPLYVDVYTTWCPPCQRMARVAFPNSMIGAKFNSYFIIYQVNAEVGEGPVLAKRYAIASYPTALFIIPTGEIVHRAVGYGGVNAMIKQADMVVKMPQVRRSRRKQSVSDEPVILVRPVEADTVKGVNYSLKPK